MAAQEGEHLALVLFRGRLWESAVTPCRPVPWVTHCLLCVLQPDVEGGELPRFGTAAPAVIMRSIQDVRERAQAFMEQHSDKFNVSRQLACLSR